MTESQATTARADSAPIASDAQDYSRVLGWIGKFVLGGAIIMIVIVIVAATLARFDMIDKIAGFVPFYLTVNPMRALAIIGIAALAYALVRGKRPIWRLAVGTTLSIGLLIAQYALLILPADGVPPIHDISTDLDDMPQFTTLDVEPVSTGRSSEAEWRAFHEEAYSDLGPIVIDKAPVDVLADAQALAEDRGWKIASFNAEAGRMEATATAGYVRFYDDVVVEVTPVADGSTRVDMRSVSRVGESDVGYNAARIREFLIDLRGL